MSEAHIYPVKKHIEHNAHANDETYQSMYQDSVANPEAFWAEHGKIIDWIKPYSKVKNTSFDTGHVDICLLYTSPSPRDGLLSRMPSSA